MLTTHGRYEFSPIDERPDYSWPDGKRLAVYIALNVEQFGWDKSVESAIAPSGMHNKQSVFAWRDYGNRYAKRLDLVYLWGEVVDAHLPIPTFSSLK